MCGGIELTSYKAGNKAAKRRANLVDAAGEPFSDQGNYAGFGAGEAGWKLEIVDIPKEPAEWLGFVVPCDAEEVQRVEIPQPNIF